MNFFSSDDFLGAVAKTGFAAGTMDIRNYRIGEQTFRLLTIHGEPVTQYPFLDFVEPLATPDPFATEIPHLPTAALRTVDAAAWHPEEDILPAPRISWDRFASLADFWASVRSRIGNLVPDGKRKWKQLERDLGPIEFLSHDESDETYRACLKWKSAQYRATGFEDMFARPAHRALFDELRERGLLKISSLTAGGTLVAAHLGVVWEGRFYYWIPAYDHAFGRYGPGRLLLHSMIESSHARGDREFDFLIGDEKYKWFYATDARVIGELGTPPLWHRASRGMKRSLRQMMKSTGVWEPLQAWRLRNRMA